MEDEKLSIPQHRSQDYKDQYIKPSDDEELDEEKIKEIIKIEVQRERSRPKKKE